MSKFSLNAEFHNLSASQFLLFAQNSFNVAPSARLTPESSVSGGIWKASKKSFGKCKTG